MSHNCKVLTSFVSWQLGKEMWYLFLCFVFVCSIEAAGLLSFSCKQYNRNILQLGTIISGLETNKFGRWQKKKTSSFFLYKIFCLFYKQTIILTSFLKISSQDTGPPLSLSLISWPAVLLYPETVSSFKMSTDTVNILLVLFLNTELATKWFHPPHPTCSSSMWFLSMDTHFEAYFQGIVANTIIYTH